MFKKLWPVYSCHNCGDPLLLREKSFRQFFKTWNREIPHLISFFSIKIAEYSLVLYSSS